jgi:hypothetical protein
MSKIFIIISISIICNHSFSEKKNINDNISIMDCSQNSEEYARSWGINPDAARAFGAKVKEAVRNQNLEQLFSMVNGELIYGPRKKFIKEKQFSDIFKEKWINDVLDGPIPCAPMGWRGLMLGNGAIWFQQDGTNEFSIFSIQGAIEEPNDTTNLPIVWQVDGKKIGLDAFSYEWYCCDNYAEIAIQLHISYTVLSENPGLLYGKEIPLQKTIVPSWEDDKDNFGEVFLAKYIESYIPPTNLIINYKGERYVAQKRLGKESYYNSDTYRLLAKINSNDAQNLAPHLKARCKEAYLVEIRLNSGGSMGWINNYGIYALFQQQDGRKLIAPLKFFHSKNLALNFLDQLREGVSEEDKETI